MCRVDHFDQAGSDLKKAYHSFSFQKLFEIKKLINPKNTWFVYRTFFLCHLRKVFI